MERYIITNVYETRAGISAVAAREDGEGDEVTLLFKASFWADEDLTKGDIIDEEKLDELKTKAELCRAVARCEGLLANSNYSRVRLIRRLEHFGFERDICEAAADYMIKEGIVREGEQTKRIANFFCKSKHWGKKRIAAELMGRGYERSAINAALESVTEEEYYTSLLALVKSKYAAPAADEAERQKRIAALARLGFSFSEINRALKEAEETENCGK